jgi:hypothetical protein
MDPMGRQSELLTHRGDGKRFVVRADEKLTRSSTLSELHARSFSVSFEKSFAMLPRF